MALAATIQASAVMPNFLITEYFVQFATTGNAISVNPITVENGYIALPTTPGLGLEIREDVLSEYSYQEFPPSSIRSYHEEWP
jgi:galactonate dehydratase